jgi:peptide-methionine (S)-S-oxide reductase
MQSIYRYRPSFINPVRLLFSPFLVTQEEIANKVKRELQEHIDQGRVTGYKGSKVSTAVVPSTVFYPAEKEHQDYLMRNPGGYCNHKYR